MASDEIQIQLTPVSRLKYTEIEAAAKRIWPDAYSSILKPGQIEHMLEMMYSPAALSREGRDPKWLSGLWPRLEGFLLRIAQALCRSGGPGAGDRQRSDRNTHT
jgi:hypothetical protein